MSNYCNWRGLWEDEDDKALYGNTSSVVDMKLVYSSKRVLEEKHLWFKSGDALWIYDAEMVV